MGKTEADARRWRDDPPMELEGWVRIPLEAGQNPWEAIPDDVAEEVDRPVLIEWRPSSMGGWGSAAVWYGPKEERYAT